MIVLDGKQHAVLWSSLTIDLNWCKEFSLKGENCLTLLGRKIHTKCCYMRKCIKKGLMERRSCAYHFCSYFVSFQEGGRNVFRSPRHLSLHLCLKSTTCKPWGNSICVAVETQILDPQCCIVLSLSTPPIKGRDHLLLSIWYYGVI